MNLNESKIHFCLQTDNFCLTSPSRNILPDSGDVSPRLLLSFSFPFILDS